jgi:hypothetical protein
MLVADLIRQHLQRSTALSAIPIPIAESIPLAFRILFGIQIVTYHALLFDIVSHRLRDISRINILSQFS